MFKSKSNEIPDFKPSAFWEHSIGTAHFSELIASELQLLKNENYYIAGLLHDIGKLLIFHVYPDKFEDIVLNQLISDLTNYESEQEILGVDHTEIGFYLSESWKFHKEINNSIGYHHKMLGSRMDLVTTIVSIANVFAKNSGLCLPWDKTVDIKSFPAWGFLKQKSKKEIIVSDLVKKVINKTDSIKEAVSDLF
jgi:putative nucleotidyltransferase with HDIG domain